MRNFLWSVRTAAMAFAILCAAAGVARAQDGTRTLGCQNADWSAGPCRSGGGGGGGSGGNALSGTLNRAFDRLLDAILPGESPAERAARERRNAVIQRGNTAKHQGRWADAEAAFRELEALGSTDPLTYLNLGNAIAEQGRYTESRIYFRRAMDREPSLTIARDLLVWTYEMEASELINRKLWAQAEAALKNALSLGDNYARVYNNLGLALENQNRFAEAEAAYQRAVELNPKDSDGHFKLGLMQIYLGRYADAEKAYRAAAQLAPSHANTRINLGWALERQGHGAEAEAQYREAIRLAPENYWGHLRLGDLLRTSKKYTEAETSYRETVRLEPKNADARFGLAYTLMEKGKRDEAEAQYREVIRLNPESTGARINLANSLLDHSQAREAEGLLRKVTELSPRYVAAYNNLGLALVQQGRYEEAEAAYRKALELDPSYKRASDNLKAMRDSLESKANSIWSAIFPGEKASGGTLQPFPSGNADVSPGTSASSAPAAGRSGGGTAMEQAKGASEYGKSARESGLSGGTVRSEEPGSDKARIVFDTAGQGASGAGDGVVDVSNIGIQRTIPPELVAKNPELRKLEARQEANNAERKRLRDRLEELRVEKGKPGADRGSLDMREVELKDRLSKNEYEAGLIRREIDQKIETAQKGAPPGQKSETKYTGYLVEFDEKPSPKQQPAGVPAERRP